MIAYVFVDIKSRPHRVAVMVGDAEAETVRDMKDFRALQLRMYKKGIPVMLSSTINWPEDETRSRKVRKLCEAIRGD